MWNRLPSSALLKAYLGRGGDNVSLASPLEGAYDGVLQTAGRPDTRAKLTVSGAGIGELIAADGRPAEAWTLDLDRLTSPRGVCTLAAAVTNTFTEDAPPSTIVVAAGTDAASVPCSIRVSTREHHQTLSFTLGGETGLFIRRLSSGTSSSDYRWVFTVALLFLAQIGLRYFGFKSRGPKRARPGVVRPKVPSSQKQEEHKD